MDYEIDIESLKSKETDLSSNFTNIEQKTTELITSLSPFLNGEIATITSNIKDDLTKINTGCKSSKLWLSDYCTELSSLEEDLKSSVNDIASLKNHFEDLFSKVTIPSLKTGGDKEENILTEENELTAENIQRILQDNQSEYNNAYKKFLSESTYITVTDLGNGRYLTHIAISDPSQIHKGYANGAYANGLETISSASQRIPDWLIGVNGSHFLYSNGGQDINNPTNHVIINDGQISADSKPTAGGLEICLTKDGEFFTAPQGASAQDLVNRGVVQTFASHETNILENGVVQTTYPDAMARQYNRTIIGMKSNGDYYIFSGYSSATEAAQLLKDHGCVWAKSLDQGGSVGLATKNEEIKQSTDAGGQRAIGDFLYFSN